MLTNQPFIQVGRIVLNALLLLHNLQSKQVKTRFYLSNWKGNNKYHGIGIGKARSKKPFGKILWCLLVSSGDECKQEILKILWRFTLDFDIDLWREPWIWILSLTLSILQKYWILVQHCIGIWGSSICWHNRKEGVGSFLWL